MRDFDGRQLDELAALSAVAREQSFVGAGRALQRHPTVVSKRIAALERRLGVRLVERTTRQVRLTDAGMLLAEELDTAAHLIREAEQEAAASAGRLQGRLRLALPASLGRQWIAPRLPEFMRMYAGLEIEAIYNESYVDIVAEGFDVAIRVGILGDSRLVAKRLGRLRRILAASPDYVERCGMPATPRELADHNCLEFTTLATYPTWRLSNGTHTEAVVARGSLKSNDSTALLEAARAGIGILGAGEWLMIDDFVEGRLVPVLPDWMFDGDGGVYVVRPSGRFTPARTRALVDWIETLFRDGTPWSRSGGA